MGLLNKLFGGSNEPKEENALPWIELTDVSQLNDIRQNSNEKTQFIFKHSTRCGISRMVKKQFEADYNLNDTDADLYYLDLIAFREVSNEIAAKFQVAHESPQLLAIKNGSVVAHDSHGAINNLDLGQFV